MSHDEAVDIFQRTFGRRAGFISIQDFKKYYAIRDDRTVEALADSHHIRIVVDRSGKKRIPAPDVIQFICTSN